MLRMNKDKSEYEIDRELTGKFAIEKNAEYQDRIAELEEENKKLKSDLAFERTMLDNVRAEYESLQNVIKKLNIKVASLEGEIKGLNSTIDRLHKEIEELEKPHPRFSDFGGYDLDQ